MPSRHITAVEVRHQQKCNGERNSVIKGERESEGKNAQLAERERERARNKEYFQG